IVRRLIGPRIDFGEEVALLDHLAFGERDLVDLAVDTGADLDRIEALNGAKSDQIDREISLFDRRCAHGNGARTGRGCLLSGFGRFRGLILLPAVVAPAAKRYEHYKPPDRPGFPHVRSYAERIRIMGL